MLAVKDLHVDYDGVTAVNGVTFDVRPGEIVALIGANGAGKSSLLRAIIGLTPKRRGTVHFAGQDLSGWPTERIVSTGLSFVGDGRELFPSMTCRDNLRAALFAQRTADAFDERAAAVFQLFPRLRERLNQQAGTLSGGEQQMLAIGRALMQDPRLLMLDEPSFGLSPALTTEVFTVIRRIRERGRTVLLVEQRARMALDVADRAYVLVVGQITHAGSAEDLRRDVSIQRSYFGL